jgi:hypothetical protein
VLASLTYDLVALLDNDLHVPPMPVGRVGE